MISLGICNDETASACLYENGKLIAAASEERFSRIKMHNCFPEKSIKYLLKMRKISLKDIDNISYAFHNEYLTKDILLNYINRSNELLKNNNSSALDIFKNRIQVGRDLSKKKEFDNWIKKNKFKKDIKINRLFHHEAHAWSACLPSQFNKSICITADARGDYESLTISLFDRKLKKLKKIYSCPSLDSLGFFYGRITGLLGYKPMRHEGKITGLAANGNFKKAMHLMKKMINYQRGRIISFPGEYYLPYYENYSLKLKNEIAKYRKEDIAAAAQKHLENILKNLMEFYCNKYKIKKINLTLAGGIFANVKLNQVLKESKFIESVFVFPQMGDGGLCVGSASYSQFIKGYKIKPITTMYLGPKILINKNEILKKFKKIHIKKYNNINLIVDSIVEDLKFNKVIGLVLGNMEFGPRALCNRSILYKSSDVTCNNWLNKRLNRTEFMPFAPVTIPELAKISFKNFNMNDQTFKYMTATTNCTKLFIEKSPATVHVDGTARPQIITKDLNEIMYKVINKWHSFSGELSLINTSFNSHEEPIIFNTIDAITELKKSIVDVVYSENQRFNF